MSLKTITHQNILLIILSKKKTKAAVERSVTFHVSLAATYRILSNTVVDFMSRYVAGVIPAKEKGYMLKSSDWGGVFQFQ